MVLRILLHLNIKQKTNGGNYRIGFTSKASLYTANEDIHGIRDGFVNLGSSGKIDTYTINKMKLESTIFWISVRNDYELNMVKVFSIIFSA